MLSVMPGGLELKARKAELASDSCRQVFRALREQYDFVLIDCPPILEAVESAWLGSAADGMIVVVEARKLKSQIINHGLRLLREQDVSVLGTVLNKRRYDLPKAIYDRV
jgi:Mrp family chromosome partitioning ATPase